MNYFNILLTKSLQENNDAYLTVLPDVLLNETQKEAINYIKKYQEDHGVLPEVEQFGTTVYGVMISKNLLNTPFSSLLDDTLKELKNAYLFSEFTRYETAVSRREIDADQIMVKAAETVSRISVSEVNDASDIQFPVFGKFVGTAVDTGIPFIDEAIGGLFPGKFNLIYAPAGSGKTYLLTYVAAYNLLKGKKVLVVRGEMGEEEYVARLLGITLGFNADSAIREAEKNQKKADELDDLCKKYINYIKSKGGGLYFTKEPTPYVSQIRTAFRKVNPDIVLIDGLYTLPVKQKFAQEFEREGSVSNQIREFAKKGVTINGVKHYPRMICTTQMNREGMKNPNSGLETIGGSIKYGQDADTVFRLQLSSISFSNADYDIKQTKARSNAPVSGMMHVDWKSMQFGFSSSDFSHLDIVNGLTPCNFKLEELK